ncbi:MAG: carboxypeptidase regulatory-like domain-containing protein [Bacteroidota bacterium]|nr:carboxypeptidase regulatory-like domain-containing protein [Bacteroidota bacterium]
MRSLIRIAAFIVPVLFFTASLFAQETTATLSGTVRGIKGEPVYGASIALTHEPTGTRAGTQTNDKGIFVIPNLKPGGPYTILISYVGFEDQKFENISLGLGANPELHVDMKNNEKNLQEVIIQTARRPGNSGITVGRQQLTMLPTIGRSLADFTRLTPQSNNNSFAGTNFRYNNLTIDGAINNDAFGFSNSVGGVSGGGQAGAAGSGTRTNPYSLDVIQEVQVQLAPYDVKLGNFTGGSVNAVTKSGTNNLHGSVYGYGRNQSLMGKSVDGTRSKIGSEFHDYQFGATIGGPIVKNKAFYIFNFEQTRRQEPTFYNAGDPGAAMTVAEGQQIASQLKTKYGYDPGSYTGAYKIFTNSNKFFGRFDFNLNPKNTLTLRGIYTEGSGNNLERSSTNFQFGSTDFTQYTKNFNITAELKTRVSNSLNNLFNISYINVHEYRDFPQPLAPYIDIDNGRITLGTWREASIYNLKQKTFEISDNVTLTKGINKFTFGTHNEFYDLTYGFINSWNGRWEYSRGLSSFLADNPSRIRGAFTTDSKIPNDRNAIFNNPPNPFSIGLLSAYAQDEISVSKNFKLSPGLRFDYSFVGAQPYLDPAVARTNSSNYASANPTYTNTPFNQLTGNLPSRITISPRLGFNYDLNGDQKFVIRGGTGIFTGRVPFAWYGYAYTLNGGTYGNIDWNSIGSGTTVPLAINPFGLKDTVSKYAAQYNAGNKAGTKEIDIFDNNFRLPTIWRSSIATDIKFGKGYKLTLDALYTKTIYDVKYEQINLKDSVQYFSTGPTQTPVYVGGKYNNAFSNVYYLTNTSKGYRYNLTAQLSKLSNMQLGGRQFSMSWSTAYTYGMSKDITNGIRNSWESSFNVNPSIIPSNSSLAYSNFDLRHRIVATWSGNLTWNKMNATSLAFFYSGQSGNPYSLVYQSAPFGSGSNAPLPYIPKTQADINLADKKDGSGNILYSASQQWNDLNALIENDSYLKTRRGQYAERNGLRTQWVHDLDMKLMHEFKLSRTDKSKSLQLSIDIFNVLNFLNNDWGHVTFVTNLNNYTVNFLQFVNDASGKKPGNPLTATGATNYTPTFNFVKPAGLNNHYYTVDPINSRWQGQVGVKLNF